MSRISLAAAALGLAACSSVSPPAARASDAAAGVAVVEAGHSDAGHSDAGRSDAVHKRAADAAPMAQPVAMPQAPVDELQRTVAALFSEPQFQRNVARAFRRGGEVDPPLTKREVELRTEVLQLISREEIDNAILRLQGRQGDGVSAEIDFMLGQLFLSREQFDEAIREYERATNAYPKFRRAWKYLGIARMRKGDYRGAATAFVQVIESGAVDGETYGLLALAHHSAADPVAAEVAFRMASMLQPNQEKWRLGLTDALVQQGRYAEAAHLAGALIKDSPENHTLWLYQAEAYVGMKDTARAAQNYEIVDQLGQSDYATLSRLGRIYFNDGLFDLAADAYLRAMTKDRSGKFREVYDIAQRLAMQSALEASKRLAKGLEQAFLDELGAADKKKLLTLRARLAGESGESAEQVALLEQIVADNPLDGAALIQLGRYYADCDQPEKAIMRFEQAAEQEGCVAEAKMCHAHLLTNAGKYGEAVPLLRASLSIKPRDDVQKLLDYAQRAAGRSK